MTEPSNPTAKDVSCLLLYGPGDARYETRAAPTITDPHDVLVRIHFVGVCGSDVRHCKSCPGYRDSYLTVLQVHFWCHGGAGTKVSASKPVIMGHEASGIIDEVGSAVTDLKTGDRVAIEPGYPCRRCEACKRGQYNLCPDMRFAASPPDEYGTLTRLFRVPGDFCYKLPDDIGLEEAVLVEPLAVAVHAAKAADIRHGDTVVVFGSGTIGLLSAAVATAFGAKKVVAVDILESKLEFARKWNHSETFKPDIQASPESNADRLVKANDLGLGADVVVEASGAVSSINTGVHVLRPGGSFVQVGVVGANVDFPIQHVAERELHVHGCFRYGAGDFRNALQMMSTGQIHVKDLISAILPFEEAVVAWEMTKRGQGIKNLIRGPGL
jgi:D-xylulose reductase